MLAISMTLLIYTHVLSVAMTMVMIIIALIIQFYRKKKIEIFLIIKLIKAAIVTLLLSLAFIGPMIEQTLYQDLNRPYVDILQKEQFIWVKSFDWKYRFRITIIWYWLNFAYLFNYTNI